jgi:hypothetical protein
MKISNIRRIVPEDFPEEMRDTISKLAIIINNFSEEVYNLQNKHVDFDNLFQELVTLKVNVDATGNPTKDTKFSTQSLSNAHGGHVIYAANSTTKTSFVASAPFVSFSSVSDGLFKVNNIKGLEAGQDYELKLVVYGK